MYLNLSMVGATRPKTPIGNGLKATRGSLRLKMADCLPSRSVTNRCCLNCRHVDKVRFSFP